MIPIISFSYAKNYARLPPAMLRPAHVGAEYRALPHRKTLNHKAAQMTGGIHNAGVGGSSPPVATNKSMS